MSQIRINILLVLTNFAMILQPTSEYFVVGSKETGVQVYNDAVANYFFRESQKNIDFIKLLQTFTI